MARRTQPEQRVIMHQPVEERLKSSRARILASVGTIKQLEGELGRARAEGDESAAAQIRARLADAEVHLREEELTIPHLEAKMDALPALRATVEQTDGATVGAYSLSVERLSSVLCRALELMDEVFPTFETADKDYRAACTAARTAESRLSELVAYTRKSHDEDAALAALGANTVGWRKTVLADVAKWVRMRKAEGE